MRENEQKGESPMAPFGPENWRPTFSILGWEGILLALVLAPIMKYELVKIETRGGSRGGKLVFGILPDIGKSPEWERRGASPHQDSIAMCVGTSNRRIQTI